jgi:hypothetical protein
VPVSIFNHIKLLACVLAIIILCAIAQESELFANVKVIHQVVVQFILPPQANPPAAAQDITQASVLTKAYQDTAGIATGRV